MSEVKPELKQCSRCHSTCTLEHFEKNRKGEWFSTCNNCRGKDKEKHKRYYNNHKEDILQKNKIYKQTINPWITCSRCQKEVRSVSFEKHQNDYLCQVHPLDPKPDFHEWVYSNPDLYPCVVEQCETDDLTIVSWTSKIYYTSSAVSDDKLKEYKDKDLRIDYIWKWRDGPHNKMQL